MKATVLKTTSQDNNVLSLNQFKSYAVQSPLLNQQREAHLSASRQALIQSMQQAQQ
jgi:hypothetical protein